MPVRRKSLRASRPLPHRVSKASNAAIKPISESTSAKRGRDVIRTFHTIQKHHTTALRDGNAAKAEELAKKIEELGGLETYQNASLNGQKADRGGDSSIVLVEWLDVFSQRREDISAASATVKTVRVLEIGSLSPNNAISKVPGVDMTRIDLHSQHHLIQTQDFMQRPLPGTEAARFDIVSCSLVLNYVPDADGRGDMLKRICQFLTLRGNSLSLAAKEHSGTTKSYESLRQHGLKDSRASESVMPCLFLVLPGPCVTNSRYLDEDRLRDIMQSLGFRNVQWKISSKLLYSLWTWKGHDAVTPQSFPKHEVNPGSKRNNFAIVLKAQSESIA